MAAAMGAKNHWEKINLVATSSQSLACCTFFPRYPMSVVQPISSIVILMLWVIVTSSRLSAPIDLQIDGKTVLFSALGEVE